METTKPRPSTPKDKSSLKEANDDPQSNGASKLSESPEGKRKKEKKEKKSKETSKEEKKDKDKGDKKEKKEKKRKEKSKDDVEVSAANRDEKNSKVLHPKAIKCSQEKKRKRTEEDTKDENDSKKKVHPSLSIIDNSPEKKRKFQLNKKQTPPPISPPFTHPACKTLLSPQKMVHTKEPNRNNIHPQRNLIQ
jgi:hypothetical protein